MFSVYGTYGVSVFALRGTTVDELAQQTPLVRFSQLTLVKVRAIRDAGLSLEPTGRKPSHYTVVLRDLEEALDALVTCEHTVLTNPYHDG